MTRSTFFKSIAAAFTGSALAGAALTKPEYGSRRAGDSQQIRAKHIVSSNTTRLDVQWFTPAAKCQQISNAWKEAYKKRREARQGTTFDVGAVIEQANTMLPEGSKILSAKDRVDLKVWTA